MPELPEMENYKRIFEKKLVGKTIQSVEVTREKSINKAVPAFIDEVKGRKLVAIERRAKHLVFKLDSGGHLLLHLMLGGLMYIGNEHDSPDRTKQVTLTFDDCQLFFIGLRLGYLHLLTCQEVEQEFLDLGPEPLDPGFQLSKFDERLKKKRGTLKSTLVNQKFIAGIGNHYSDEICFEAKLLPMRIGDELSSRERASLFHAIQTILNRGLTYGGYIEMPVCKGDELTGKYNEYCYVYDREGEPCPRCKTTIIREEISSKKSFFCPQCQI
ncbi:DNA-formamidopyrimidine glycosylase [Metabacillus halosaccharovorans]|uniref:Formamidopyrimidine-DNA glycosylase n=1 Tax=Metabacillus halosaccharovorans TaxID=930124 RepID=A0ABT3DGG9_9BACI|nr:DNA-formamidopyrimidine glycosylase [Metabacillus halosaccharovorans]MCV9886155.1 DNA-formamidopyrimidine glycosylase [Metabacillus halosaccharovorans]